MKREDIQKAVEVDNEILEIERSITAWKKSAKFNGSSKIQIREPYMQGSYFDIDLSAIPFEELKNTFIKSLDEQKAKKEDLLNIILQ
ncbi:hypothetical protein [Chryseobacterium indologenes]|uniref:Uncharacterized protein n=1 Tax=Chryseobacterium indologenes TaxID=253 RepID=A0A0N0IWD7_CHRID|nr:hypothetical protein [Chryseobacterium indologenes]KPE51252.1 hypothetical protein AOB46_11350 [Chryseobacterium indologenes]